MFPRLSTSHIIKKISEHEDKLKTLPEEVLNRISAFLVDKDDCINSAMSADFRHTKNDYKILKTVSREFHGPISHPGFRYEYAGDLSDKLATPFFMPLTNILFVGGLRSHYEGNYAEIVGFAEIAGALVVAIPGAALGLAGYGLGFFAGAVKDLACSRIRPFNEEQIPLLPPTEARKIL